MKIWKSAFLAWVIAGVLMAAAGTRAQNLQRGEIRGYVYDTTHALVPNAKVTISNVSTGFRREYTTDATGSYEFPQLLPGTYKLQAEAAGFAMTQITDVVVDIGASIGLDITLPVKGQTQTVTVSAEATAAVDTATAGINQVINQKNLEDLPLSGRDYRDLAELSSSAQVVPGLRGGIRLGGQQSDFTGLVIDGQDSFNNFFGEFVGSLETKNFTIPLDAVQEFQVVTDGFAPEFGRATGGLINVITKSGSNELHGEAHEYYRGGSLTENDAIGEAPNITDQNQFGGSVGFPIHKDRQFLFIATDVQREYGPLVTQICPPSDIPNAQSQCLAALPTITGPTFANCTPGVGACATGGGSVPLPSNLTGTGAMLPSGCGTPAAGDLVLKDCYGVTSLAGFQGPHNQFQRLFTILGHYDYQFSAANHFSIRSYFTRNHTDGFSGGVGQNEIPMPFDGTENFINKGGSVIFSLNTALGKKVNELRFSVQDEVRERHPNSTSPGLTLSDGDLTLGSAFAFGAGERYFLPINNQDGKLQAADNFDYIFGKHDIKFGGDIDVFEDRKDSFVGWSAGQYDFFALSDFEGGGAAGSLSQGVALNGLPLNFLGPATTEFPNYQSDLGLYWQDKWAITPSVTLTYGLRWDGTWNPQPQTPLLGSAVLVGVGPLGAGTSAQPVPQRWPADFNQWGPRVGVAWNARRGDRPTVVRAAWGLYYAPAIAGIFTPTQGSGNLTHCIGGCNFPDHGLVGFPYLNPNSTTLAANQLCHTPDPVTGTIFGCPQPSTQGDYIDPRFENPRVSSVTGSVEQTLARNLTLTATYAYVHSTHLRTGGYPTEEAWARNFVQCPAPMATDAFGRAYLCGLLDNNLSIATGDTASFSHGNYHSVVINITKRFSNHFQVFTNYIWSQNKDNGSSERDTDTYFGTQDPFNIAMDYGRNSLDIKHQFKAAGVYELPLGFAFSSSVIAHTGVPYPLYVNVDVNGDAVSNNGHNNDRPTVQLSNGKVVLLNRYPFNQPGFAEWDARLQKDFAIKERYHALLSADFFNLTNRANVYSNPDTSATIDYQTLGGCEPNSTLFPTVTGIMGSTCGPLTAPLTKANMAAGGPYAGYRSINQVAPGSTPFAFQAGFKFIF